MTLLLGKHAHFATRVSRLKFGYVIYTRPSLFVEVAESGLCDYRTDSMITSKGLKIVHRVGHSLPPVTVLPDVT